MISIQTTLCHIGLTNLYDKAVEIYADDKLLAYQEVIRPFPVAFIVLISSTRVARKKPFDANPSSNGLVVLIYIYFLAISKQNPST